MFQKYVNLPWHLTPASSEWPLQVRVEFLGQSMSLLSLPVQSTLSRYIGPTPAPKWALLNATASVVDNMGHNIKVTFTGSWLLHKWEEGFLLLIPANKARNKAGVSGHLHQILWVCFIGIKYYWIWCNHITAAHGHAIFLAIKVAQSGYDQQMGSPNACIILHN